MKSMLLWEGMLGNTDGPQKRCSDYSAIINIIHTLEELIFR